MNDLLKAAQAVLDVWDKLDNGKWETEGDFHNLDCQYREALDTLRQAVEQAKGVEAVGRIMIWKGSKFAPQYGKLVIRSYQEFPESETFKKDCPWENDAPVYTAPPSVGALIAEIEGVKTWCEGNDQSLSCSYDEVYAVLGKYRSVK
jgi:hypothetical protein